MDGALKLLSEIWRFGGWGELRSYRGRDEGGQSWWAEVGRPGAVERALTRAHQANVGGWHIAHGVQPRCVAGDGTGANVRGYGSLVLDFDSAEEADHGLGVLLDLELVPSLTVASGRGLHVYLLLDELVPCLDGQRVNQRLCQVTGSDPVHDPPRIMRTPGTTNWRVLREAEVQEWDGRRYSLAAIEGRLPAPTHTAPVPLTPNAPIAATMSQAIEEAVGQLKQSAYRSRSELTFALCRKLKRAGLSDAEVKSRIMATELAERGEADIDRCLSKLLLSEGEVIRVRAKLVRDTSAGTSVRLEAMSGRMRGEVWWQHLAPGIEARVVACMGGVPIREWGVTAQVGGWVRVSYVRHEENLVPRVQFWYPAKGGE